MLSYLLKFLRLSVQAEKCKFSPFCALEIFLELWRKICNLNLSSSHPNFNLAAVPIFSNIICIESRLFAFESQLEPKGWSFFSLSLGVIAGETSFYANECCCLHDTRKVDHMKYNFEIWWKPFSVYANLCRHFGPFSADKWGFLECLSS